MLGNASILNGKNTQPCCERRKPQKDYLNNFIQKVTSIKRNQTRYTDFAKPTEHLENWSASS